MVLFVGLTGCIGFRGPGFRVYIGLRVGCLAMHCCLCLGK